jgi:peptide/nickel transport system substrate-binding protein
LVLKTPFAPLIAQLTDRSGMMVSPKAAMAAGDKFGLHPVCAGPYRFIERVPQAAVRQALDAAIDREALDQVVFNGEFVPGDQWVNPENFYYQQNFPVPKRDLAKAKALLKQAGVTIPFDVDFMVPKGAEPQSVAEVIQAMAAEIGINMKIRVTEFATSLKQAEAGEYEAYLLDWSGRSDPDGNLYSFYKCKAPLNYTGLCDADVDKLLDESRVPSDRAQRKAIYEKLTRLLIVDDESIIYLYHRRMLIAHTARLEGYRQLPDGMVRVVGLTLK